MLCGLSLNIEKKLPIVSCPHLDEIIQRNTMCNEMYVLLKQQEKVQESRLLDIENKNIY